MRRHCACNATWSVPSRLPQRSGPLETFVANWPSTSHRGVRISWGRQWDSTPAKKWNQNMMKRYAKSTNWKEKRRRKTRKQPEWRQFGHLGGRNEREPLSAQIHLCYCRALGLHWRAMQASCLERQTAWQAIPPHCLQWGAVTPRQNQQERQMDSGQTKIFFH